MKWKTLEISWFSKAAKCLYLHKLKPEKRALPIKVFDWIPNELK